MKKIFLLLLLLAPLKVWANTKILAMPMGPIFKVYYKDQTTFANSYSRPGIYTNKFQYLYRLTFKEDFYTSFYTMVDDELMILNRISKEQLQVIKDYVLYGYEQLPVKNEACYLALQKLIYETYENVDKLIYYDNIFADYNECESKIINLANINQNGPRLTSLTGDINTFFDSEDLNKIIDNYQIIEGNDNSDFTIENNQLIGNIKQDHYTLTLSRQMLPAGKTLYYYRSNTDLIADFKFEEPQHTIIEIKANHYPINIINMDDDNNTITSDSTIELLNANYEIMKTINMKGIYEDDLIIPKGTYYLKQISASNDYSINNNVYPIEIDDNDNSITIMNQKNQINVINDDKKDNESKNALANNISNEIEFIKHNSNLVKKQLYPNYKDNVSRLSINQKISLHKDESRDVSKLIYKETKPNIMITKNNMFPFLIFLLMLYTKQKSLN